MLLGFSLVGFVEVAAETNQVGITFLLLLANWKKDPSSMAIQLNSLPIL